MSKLISRSLAFLFTLTVAGAASARRPPPLVEAQAQADSVLATCSDGPARSTAGYRDMLARAPSAKPADFSAAVSALETRRVDDHLVIVCAGGAIRPGSGYRDFPARLYKEPATPQVASVATLVGSR